MGAYEQLAMFHLRLFPRGFELCQVTSSNFLSNARLCFYLIPVVIASNHHNCQKAERDRVPARAHDHHHISITHHAWP